MTTLNKYFKSISFPKNKIVLFVFIFLAGSVLVLALIPVAANHYLTGWLIDNGADSAAIKDVDINPFTGQISLTGVDVKKDGKIVFADSTVYFDLGLRSLFSNRFLIQRSRLKDIVIDIEQYENGSIRIGSYRMPPTSVNPTEQVQKDTSLPWVFQAKEVLLDNVKVNFTRPDLKAELKIMNASVERFSTAPQEASGKLDLKGAINGAPLEIALAGIALGDGVSFTGKCDIQDFKLNGVADLLKSSIESLGGTIDLSGNIDLDVRSGSRVEVHYNGLISIDDTEIKSSTWGTAGSMNWQGELDFTQPQTDESILSFNGVLKATDTFYQQQDSSTTIQSNLISIQGKTEGRFGSSFSVDSSASLSLDRFSINQGNVSLSQQKGSWEGTITYADDIAHPGNDIEAKGNLSLTDLSLKIPDVLSLTQGDISFHGNTSILASESVGVSHSGTFQLKNTELTTDQLTFQSDSTDWKGDAGYRSEKDEREVKIDGSLDMATINLGLPEKKISMSLDNIKLNSSGSLYPGNSSYYSGVTNVSADTLGVFIADSPLLSLGTVLIDALEQNQHNGFTVEKTLLGTVNMPPSLYQPQNIKIDSIELDNLGSTFDFSRFNLDRIRLFNPKIINPDSATTLAEMNQITARDAVVNEFRTVTVNSISSGSGMFLTPQRTGGQTPIITLGELQIDRFSWNAEKGATIGSAKFSDLFGSFDKYRLSAQPEGATAPPLKEHPDQSSSTSAPEKTDRFIPVRINLLELKGKSGLIYKDFSVSPTFAARVDISHVAVSSVDLTQTEQPFTYEIEATVNEYAPLKITGKAAPLASPLSMQQHAVLQNFPLPDLSPYVIEAIGSEFKAGRLRVDSTLDISGSEIKSDNTLMLSDTRVRTLDNSEALQQFNKKLPVPLDTAIFLLTDDKKNITLSIPISGTLDQLKIGIGDIVVTALSKSITTSVTPYLAYTVLGPTGALAYLGVSLGKTLLSTDLPVISFAPGDATLDGEQLHVLDRVSEQLQKMFAQNPDKTISICPKVVAGETTDEQGKSLSDQAVRKALYRLGDARSSAVREYLVGTRGLRKDRLLSCSPEINFNQDSRGLVEFRE